MGNRFLGGIKSGAMPPLHRYLGNPVLTGIGRLLLLTPCGDFHCGLRGFRKDVIAKLNLRTTLCIHANAKRQTRFHPNCRTLICSLGISIKFSDRNYCPIHSCNLKP